MPVTPTRKRGPLLAIAGVAAVAIVALFVSQMGGGAAPTTTVSADSAAKLAAATPDSGTPLAPAAGGVVTDSASRVGGTPGVATNSTTVAATGRPATPALDSAANRLRGSIFTVARGRARATGFLADGEGMVLTSSAAVGATPTVDVFFDGARRVPGRVVLVDSTRGLAAVLVHTRHCPSTCNPLTIASDRVQAKQGDTVMAMTPGTIVSAGSRPKGTLTTVTNQRLSAALGLGDVGSGAPVLLPDGNVIGVARSGGRTANLVPASMTRAFLREAQAERRSKSIEPVDSLRPSWPSQPIAGSEIVAGTRRTSADLDAFRVPVRNDFVALVMTPQILALRKSEADTLRKYFNPGLSTTMFCDGNGPCDPLETWTSLGDYLSERRAVVVIQVAPSRLPPPFRGEHNRRDMNRRPILTQVEVVRGGTVVPPIESHRIYSVVNPNDYPENQRDALYSGLLVFNPNDLLQGGALEIRVRTLSGRDQIRLAIPAPVVEAVRRDLAAVLR
jgi:hypothetical protein